MSLSRHVPLHTSLLLLTSLSIDRCYGNAPLRRRSRLCRLRCRSRLLPDSNVPVRMVRVTALTSLPCPHITSPAAPPSGSVVPVCNISYPHPLTSIDTFITSRVMLSVGHHHWSSPRFRCQQRHPCPSQPLVLPHSHFHPIHLGPHPLRRHVLPPRG